jgi:hypothetical protein
MAKQSKLVDPHELVSFLDELTAHAEVSFHANLVDLVKRVERHGLASAIPADRLRTLSVIIHDLSYLMTICLQQAAMELDAGVGGEGYW